MPELNEAQVKAALSAAKERRRKYSNVLRQSDISERCQLRANRRRYSEKLFSTCLANVSEFDAIRSQSETEMRHFLEQQKAALIKVSSSVKDVLRSDLANWRKAAEYLVSQASSPILNWVAIDTPAFVIPTQDIVMSKPNFEPWNSSVKFSGRWETPYANNGTDDLSFVFAWENPSGKYAVANVMSSLILNGFCDAWADGGVFVYNSVYLDISAGLDIWWDSPPQQTRQSQDVVTLDALANGIFEVGDYKSSGINGYYGFNYDQLVIPPGGVTIFEVSVSIGHAIFGHGNTSIDFASGDFEAVCPAVLLAILT